MKSPLAISGDVSGRSACVGGLFVALLAFGGTEASLAVSKLSRQMKPAPAVVARPIVATTPVMIAAGAATTCLAALLLLLWIGRHRVAMLFVRWIAGDRQRPIGAFVPAPLMRRQSISFHGGGRHGP